MHTQRRASNSQVTPIPETASTEHITKPHSDHRCLRMRPPQRITQRSLQTLRHRVVLFIPRFFFYIPPVAVLTYIVSQRSPLPPIGPSPLGKQHLPRKKRRNATGRKSRGRRLKRNLSQMSRRTSLYRWSALRRRWIQQLNAVMYRACFPLTQVDADGRKRILTERQLYSVLEAKVDMDIECTILRSALRGNVKRRSTIS